MATSAVARPPHRSNWQRRDQLTAMLFMAPAALLLLVFLITPFTIALGMSFTDQRLIPNPRVPTEFVGLTNFIRMFSDETFLHALLNNFTFALIVVPIQTALALLLAVLINQKMRLSNFFRTVYFAPVVVPMVVVSVVWTFLYNPGEGTINYILQALSGGRLGPFDWLGSTNLAFPAIMVLSIWQGVGFQMVIYLAGLQEISTEVYEASSIDGANKLQQFFSITLPMLRNTTIFVVLATTILAFRLFQQVDIMTRGGPQDATITTMVHVVNQGFRQLKVGYASSLTVTFFLIVLAISLLQRVFLREERTIQ